MKLFTDLNLNLNELQNAVVQVKNADPAVASSKKGQLYFLDDGTTKALKYFDGTSWVAIGEGALKSIAAKAGEYVINVDNTDPANPKLELKISATQGTSVKVTEESDGLKVEVEDGDLTKKGIVQLSSEYSDATENKAVTPKGANVKVVADTPSTGSSYTYKLTQGGNDVAEKIEIKTATDGGVFGVTTLDNTPSASENTKAATPKGANVTVTKDSTPAVANAYSYTLAQGQQDIATKVEMPKGTTAVVGMVQLSNAVSDSDDVTAATPKGANVKVAEVTTGKTEGSAYTYKLTQGGSDVATKIEMKQAVEAVSGGAAAVVGMVEITSVPSATENTKAATPKGANVTLTKQATAEEGYFATYVLAQGGTDLATKINIPKDFLVKSGKVVTASMYAVNTAYAKGDIVHYTDVKCYIVKADISATDNTGWDKMSVQELTTSAIPIGEKALVFVVNVKEGTANDEFIVIPVKDLVDIYTGDKGIEVDANNQISVKNGDGLAITADDDKKVYVNTGDGLVIDGTSKKVKVDVGSGLVITSNKVDVNVDGTSLEVNSNKVKIKNEITAQVTKAVYPVTLTENGLVSSYGDAVRTAKKTSGTIASGATSVKVALTASQELLDYFVLDATGNKVVTDVAVAADGVTFSVVSTTETLTCYVVYQDTALQSAL